MKLILNKTRVDVSDYLSMSKRKEPEAVVNTLATLIPVQLDAETMSKFVQAFHPSGRTPKAPQAFLFAAIYMADLSAYINAVFAGLRYGVGLVKSELEPAKLGEHISLDIDLTYKNAGDIETRAKTYLMDMASGHNHIIIDSERYKGGKDILYSGLRGPNKSPLLGAENGSTSSLPILTSSYAYKDSTHTFETDIGKAIIETGWAIQKLVLGEHIGELSNSYKRARGTVEVLKITKVVEEIAKIFMKGPLSKLGIPVMLPVFKGVMSPYSLERLPEYTSILALKEPSHTIVVAKTRNKEIPEESLGISTAYQALQPDLRFSFIVNLPKEFCEYITQTKDAQIPLVPLNTWAVVWSSAMLRPPHARSQGGRIVVGNAPKYVLLPSASEELIARRKKLNLYTEKGRVNEDGLMITGEGDLHYMFTAEDTAVENAKAYEKLSEEALQVSFEAGAPITSGSAGPVFELTSPDYGRKITELKASLAKYKGSVQAINWDLNSVLTVNTTDSSRLHSTKLIGGSKPEALNMAVYLRDSFSFSMANMFSRSKQITSAGKQPFISRAHFSNVRDGVTTSTLFAHFAHVYNHFLKLNKVPNLKGLVDKAAAELKVATLTDETVVDYEVLSTDTSRSIYKQIIGVDLSVMEAGEKTGQAIVALLGVAAFQASAQMGTNLARVCLRDNIEFTEHDRYFEGSSSPAGDFGRLYTWLGGQVFLQAIRALVEIPKKDLIAIQDVEYSPTNSDAGHPGFVTLISEVLPMCVFFSKYVMPEIRDAIYKEADAVKEKESSFTESDLNLAGSRPKNPDGSGGMKLFPHQAEALSKLKAHPKIAILDIAAGGGKTTIGISDIACLYADGLIKRPFVIAPNRLVKNWIEDCHQSFKGWNTIPITTETYNSKDGGWGDERLTELISNAPPNTIIIVGNSFLSNKSKTQLVIGNAVEKVSNAIEFCKKFEPDYVIIDESHRVRNVESAIHKSIKTIMQMSSVKYGRIATGTLIQNVLSDVVGQSAVFNGQIFRTKDEYDADNKREIVEGMPLDYTEDTPLKTRRRLSDFATVISYRRKEWAWMLPIPIEKFISVDMEEYGDAGHKLQQFYNAVLTRTLEEAKKDPRLNKKKKDDDDADDADDAEATTRTVESKSGAEVDVSDDDDDSDTLDDFEAALEPYLQRLERILTDPLGDQDPLLVELAKRILGDDFDANYATPKVQKVIERINLHFKDNPWHKGMRVKPSEVVDFNGNSYIYKVELHSDSDAEISNHAPDTDTDSWKPQSKGKIFIVCRYVRSVEAIFKALPKNLQAQTLKFHGKADNKDDSISRFQTDDKIKILIANEEGVTEGHNFQMASRFIRVEAPWTPGALDQTASRIFRPDVKGVAQRQTIFLDWILCDNTLEVAKMGRLVSKMLKRTKFDELHNPTYYKNLNPDNLGIIKMSLRNIVSCSKLNDLCESSTTKEGDSTNIHPNSYLGQYKYLVKETSREFREMKKTRRSHMIDVEPTPMPDTAKRIEFTPWVSNLSVEDINNDGLIPLRDFLEDETKELALACKKNPKALLNQFVRTEFGLGIITRVTTKDGKNSDESDSDSESESSGRAISKVNVQFIQGGGMELLTVSKVYLATNISEETKNKYNKVAPKITARDRARTERNRIKAEKALERIRQREAAAKARAKKVGTRVAKKERIQEAVAAREIVLYPVIYNEFLALEGMEDAADSKALGRYGFTRFGNYAYCSVKTYQNFTGLLTFLEKQFTLSPKTLRYLDMLHDSFQAGRGRKFDIALAPTAEFPTFYRMRHILTPIKNKRKPELKAYPVVINQKLMLVVDLATNPVFRKYLNKAIPGMVGGKFQEADGMDIQFFKNKTALVAKVKELRQNGFKITNLDELKEEVAALSLRAAKSDR